MHSSISNLDTSNAANRDIHQKINNRMANNVEPDEMAHYEPSYLDLHCLQRYLFWSTGLKRLIQINLPIQWYLVYHKYSNRQAWANSVQPDQII